VTFLVAAFLLPLLIAVRHDVTTWRYLPYPGADRYVADLLGYVTPGPRQTLLGPVVGRAFDPNVTEATVFTGWFTMALGLAAVASARLRRSHGAWIVLGGVSLVLSLGNTLHVGGRDTGFPLFFPLVQMLPFFHHLRAPCRFSILVVLSLAVLLSAVWTSWLAVTTPARRTLLTAAAATLMAAESLAIPIPLFAAGAPAVFQRIAQEPGDFTVLEVPGIDQVPGQIMYRQTLHGKRIFIGIAARVPAEKGSYFYGLRLVRPLMDLRKQRVGLDAALGAEEREAAPEVARFLGIRYFVIEKAYEGRGLVRFLESVLPIERAAGDDERVVLRVRPEALPPIPWHLDAGAPASRLYFEAGWWPPKPEGGRLLREASGLRSTVLFRRPSADPLDAVLAVSAPEGAGDRRVEGRVGGTRVGRALLHVGSEVRWPLPVGAAEDVERLELLWSAPGARIAALRFERR
jgi:GNAT superfamily N-acetyltransferase